VTGTRVVDGKVTRLQFLEDSHAIATSLRKDGTLTVHTGAGEDPFEV
jgi:hypothetical protein